MTMTTSRFITQLEASIKRLESLVQTLQSCSFHPSNTQYQDLADLGLRLNSVATNFPIQVTALKNRRAEPSIEEGRKLIALAQAEKRDLLTSTHLKSRVGFARNITYFFDGQKDSIVDSDATKARKQLVRERCERICALRPDGLISWAVAFMPTIWTANMMSKDTFSYVFDHIEPDNFEVWPPEVYHILSGLGDEEPLHKSPKYHAFLRAAYDDKRQARSTNRPRKRPRLSNETLQGTEITSLLPQHFSSTPDQQVSQPLIQPLQVQHQDNPQDESIPSPLPQSRDLLSGIMPYSRQGNSTSGSDSLSFSETYNNTPVTILRANDRLRTKGLQVSAKPIPLKTVIGLDKPTLRRVLEQPNNVIGTIWIGSLPGYPPFISLTLSRELDSTIIEYGEEINLPEPSPDTAVIVEGFYIIKLEHFREIIEKEGFGAIYWNECQSEGCVTIEVLDKDVVAECLGKSSRVS